MVNTGFIIAGAIAVFVGVLLLAVCRWIRNISWRAVPFWGSSSIPDGCNEVTDKAYRTISVFLFMVRKSPQYKIQNQKIM